MLKIVTEMGAQSAYGFSQEMADQATKSYLKATESEKKEMQSLNERLGNYINRVSGLEARNRQLADDLEAVRGKWGSETNEIKIKFSQDLRDARANMDDESRRKAELETKIGRLQDELKEFRAKYDDIHLSNERDRDRVAHYMAMLADAEGDANQMRQRHKMLVDDERRYGKENLDLAELINKTRNDLDEETLSRIDFQNQVQTLMEELEFLRRVHDMEIKELQALLNTQPADTRDFFKNEIALAIRDIKDEYDAIGLQGKSDMESWYKLKVSEVKNQQTRQVADGGFQRDEVTRLRTTIAESRDKLGSLEYTNNQLESQVKDLNHQLESDIRSYESSLNERDSVLRKMRSECQMLVTELQNLLETKQILDTEIAIYRKMLEGEESRSGLRGMVEESLKSHSVYQSEGQEMSRSSRADRTTRTTFQRSAKGNVAIADCDVDGNFIVLENTHRSKEEDIGGWRLKRSLDSNMKQFNYTFPDRLSIRPGQTIKIWARVAEARFNPPHELIFEGETSWGHGTGALTTLVNREQEERATFTQRTVNVK